MMRLEEYPFRMEVTVPQYDCDPMLRLKPSSALRYMQVAAELHLDTLGLTHKTLYDEGIIFVVSANGIKYYRAPMRQEKVIVATCPVKARGASMLRETVIFSAEGEPLVEGQSCWVMIQPVTNRLLRATEFHHELPLHPDWQPFCDPTHIRIRAGAEPCGEREVRLADIDLNWHMNNTVYGDILLDCFAEEFLESGGVDTLFLRYRNQARLGETLTLTRGFDGQVYSVGAQVGEKACFQGAFSLKST